MAYKQSVIETARQFYVLEGKTVDQISQGLNIPLKTVYNWVRKYEWDKDIKNAGNVGLYLEMQRQFQAKIQEAIDAGRFADPSTADALWKTAKIMERMAPQKMMLSNIFNFLEDLTTYFTAKVDDADFMEKYKSVLPELADWLRKKYTNE